MHLAHNAGAAVIKVVKRSFEAAGTSTFDLTRSTKLRARLSQKQRFITATSAREPACFSAATPPGRGTPQPLRRENRGSSRYTRLAV